MGRLWRDRNFRLLWTGETTSRVGSNVTSVALPLVAVVTLRANAFVVSALTATGWLPWLVIGLPAGAWVDRWRRRRVMLTCDAVSAVAFASVPMAAWWGVLTVAQLLVVAFVTGTASVFFTTAYRAYLPSLVAPADLPAANATLTGSEAAAQLGGRSVGGLVAQWLGAVFGLLVDAVTFVVSAVCLVAIRADERAAPARERSLVRDIGEGLRWLAGDRYLRVFAVYAALGNLALTGYQAVQVVFLVRVVGVSAGGVGVLVAVTGAGGILGALVATRITRRFGTARGLVYCLVGTLPAGLLIPLTVRGPGLVFLVVGGLLLGFGVLTGNVVGASFRQAYCPEHLLGRVIATGSLLANGLAPAGALLAGASAEAIGVRPTVWIAMGLLVGAGAIVVVSPLGRGRDLPSGPATTSTSVPGLERG